MLFDMGYYLPKLLMNYLVIVAQLVEPRIVIPVVVGSSPISHPSLSVKRLKRGKKVKQSELHEF